MAEPSGVHHFYLGDEDLGVLDERKLSVSDGLVIENASATLGQRMTTKQVLEGVNIADARATITLVWFLRWKQNPSAVAHISTIDFAFADLRQEEEPNPTQESSGGSDATTSELSQNSAT